MTVRAAAALSLLVASCAQPQPPVIAPSAADMAPDEWDAVVLAWSHFAGPLEARCLNAAARTRFRYLPGEETNRKCGVPPPGKRFLGCARILNREAGTYYEVLVSSSLSPMATCKAVAHELLHVLDNCHGKPFGPNHPKEVFARSDSVWHEIGKSGALEECADER